MGLGNRPAVTAIEEGKDECSLITNPCGADDGGRNHCPYNVGADIMSFPFNSLSYDHFSGHDIQGDCRSDPLDLNCSPDPKTDGNVVDVKSNMFCRKSEMLYPNVSTRRFHNAIDGNNSVRANCLMNTAATSMDHFKSEVDMNFSLRWDETGTGYPIKAHGVEAKNSRMSWLQTSGNFSSFDCSTSLLPLVDNIVTTRNKTDVNTIPLSFSSSPQTDQDFLTLGIRSHLEIRSTSNFSTREISSKLDDVTSQCNISIVGHCPKNPLDLNQLMDKAARIQTSAGGLSSSACNLARRAPSLDECELIGDNRFRLNSVSFPCLHAPQANAQSNSSVKDFGKGIRPNSNFNTREMMNSTYLASQPISQQQDYCRKNSMKVSSESSENYLSHRHKKSPISHVQLGQFDAYDNVGHVEALGNNLFSERTGFQSSKICTFQSAAAGLFPKRLGLQPNDVATAQATRGPPIHFAAQLNPFRPSISAGQSQQAMPGQSSKDPPRVDYSNGQIVPVAKFDVRPQASPIVSYLSLKRKATENSITGRSVQRRKVFPQPVYSASVQKQSIPATPAPIPTTVHIPPAPFHVKWQGFEEHLKSAGQNCLLCKRDLSFIAEGLVHQPAAPPVIAVLACGHAFHDHCLQKITPEDQSKNPPCIPCAIGET